MINVGDENRATDGEAELILAEFPLVHVSRRVLKKIGGVEFIIANKFPGGAVKLVGAGFDGGVQYGPAGAAKLRAEVAGLNLELLDRIHRRFRRIGGAVEEID